MHREREREIINRERIYRENIYTLYIERIQRQRQRQNVLYLRHL